MGAQLGGGMIDNALGTNIFGSNSTDKAISAQQSGTASANRALADTYQSQKDTLNPYAQVGGVGLTGLTNLAQNGADMTQDPGYQFRLDEGNKAITNAAAARGLGTSGATLKALTKYGQDYASNEYNNAYNRQFNTLSSLAGIGQNASNNIASATGAYGSNLSNNYMGQGNATAAANIAQGQQQSGMVSQGIGAAAMMFSDKRLKTDIKEISREEIQEFRRTLKPYLFKYLSEEYGAGTWVGVMAQDLEKSKLGRTIVFENQNGEKQIDIKKAVSLLLALQAEV